MKKLKLPNFKGPSFPSRVLSMDAYLEFVQWYRQHLFNKEAYEFWRDKMRVNVPFRITKNS